MEISDTASSLVGDSSTQVVVKCPYQLGDTRLKSRDGQVELNTYSPKMESNGICTAQCKVNQESR